MTLGNPPRWLRWGARDGEYPHHVRATHVPLSMAVQIIDWCRATVGLDANEAGNEGRWNMWVQPEIHASDTVTMEIGFRRETDCVIFVMAWTGDITPA